MSKEKKDCQQEIAKWFKSGKKLTVQMAFRFFGTTELRRIISRLKKHGLTIISKRVAGEDYHEYWMPLDKAQ